MVKVPIQVIWDEPLFNDLKTQFIKSESISDTDAKKKWDDLSVTKKSSFKTNYEKAVFEATAVEEVEP